jgi:hypothetical protein
MKRLWSDIVMLEFAVTEAPSEERGKHLGLGTISVIIRRRYK